MAAVLTEISTLTPPLGAPGARCVRDAPDQKLTCHDRCDCSALEGDKTGRALKGTCGAQALVRVTLVSGPQMLFCGHHYGVHGPKISRRAKVAVVHDERAQFLTVSVSAAPAPGRTPLVSAK